MLTPRPCREQDSHRMHKTGPRLGLFPCRYRRSYPLFHHHHANHLPQPPGLALRLEQAENVVLANCLLLAFFSCLCCDGCVCVPGPLTLRMMLRVVSSMNSTRHWVTPPREPAPSQILLSFQLDVPEARGRRRTGAAENAGDLDELDGDLGGFHDDRLSGSAPEQFWRTERWESYCEKSCDGCVVGGPGVVLRRAGDFLATASLQEAKWMCEWKRNSRAGGR